MVRYYIYIIPSLIPRDTLAQEQEAIAAAGGGDGRWRPLGPRWVTERRGVVSMKKLGDKNSRNSQQDLTPNSQLPTQPDQSMPRVPIKMEAAKLLHFSLFLPPDY